MEFYERLKLVGLGGPPWSGEGKAAYWESVAHLAVRTFEGKDQFMDWVRRSYLADENRFAASVCWDIIKLRDAQIEGKSDA